ncbi:MAG TPA: hypothetical protein VGE76_18945 [Opitutaceae bacterium]
MLLRQSILEGIAERRIDRVFRRWRRPTVKPGGTLKTAIGLLRIETIEAIAESSLTASDARHSGHASLAELEAELAAYPEGTLYRIGLRLEGPDPRLALRETTTLSDADWRALSVKLSRLDQGGAHGPWIRRVLEVIAANPRERALDLSRRLGLPKDWLKINIRKLKNLGLTISHETGYAISPRGAQVLALLK